MISDPGMRPMGYDGMLRTGFLQGIGNNFPYDKGNGIAVVVKRKRGRKSLCPSLDSLLELADITFFEMVFNKQICSIDPYFLRSLLDKEGYRTVSRATGKVIESGLDFFLFTGSEGEQCFGDGNDGRLTNRWVSREKTEAVRMGGCEQRGGLLA